MMRGVIRAKKSSMMQALVSVGGGPIYKASPSSRGSIPVIFGLVSTRSPLSTSSSSTATTATAKVTPTYDYTRERAAYRRAVSERRIQYAKEVAAQRAAEEARKAAEREILRKQREERQRAKNARSAANALREEEKRRNRAAEFAEELKETQKRREARKARYVAARKLLLAELEEESKVWMTTREEVEEAMENAATDLWALPMSAIGAPPEDADFWRMQSYTLDMSNTYLLPREQLLAQVHEELIVEAGAPGYRKKMAPLMEKAQLRARVITAGLHAIEKARAMEEMERTQSLSPPSEVTELYGSQTIEPKFRTAAPSLDFMKDVKAQEQEGVKVLMENPVQFLEAKPFAYPVILAEDTPPDTRSAKAKAKMAKEDEKMAAAAEAEGEDFENDSAGPAVREPTPSLMGEKWAERMYAKHGASEGVTLEELQKVPVYERFTEEDIEWVMSQLQERIDALDEYESRIRAEEEEEETTESQTLTQRPTPGDLTPEEYELVELAESIMAKMSKDEHDALAALDVHSIIKDGDLGNRKLMNEIRKCCDTDSKLDDTDIQHIISIEQRLIQDDALRKKIAST